MNKQIAHELGISGVTVKAHRHNLMAKMGARSVAELVRMAEALRIDDSKVTGSALRAAFGDDEDAKIF